MKYLSDETSLYMIKLKANRHTFIIQNESNELAELLKAENKHGIESIKRFENGKFKTISKTLAKAVFSYNTENIVELNKLNY